MKSCGEVSKREAVDSLRIITGTVLRTSGRSKKLFLEEIQIARQDWELLVQEAENSGEGLSEGEMKKILLSKLTPETKEKIRDSQADQKVLGNWVEVRGLPETMGKMAVRELLDSISATGLKDITIREGRWRVGFHDSEQSEFFCSMVDEKVKYKGTVLKVRPWIFSYGVEQIWDQLEKYANLERQKSQDAQGFGSKVSAVGDKSLLRVHCPWKGRSSGVSHDRRSQVDALRSQDQSVQN